MLSTCLYAHTEAAFPSKWLFSKKYTPGFEESWRNDHRLMATVKIYHTDNHHQSLYGAYLKSCVNYLLIYGKAFGKTPADCMLPSETAAYLRSVAERVVLK